MIEIKSTKGESADPDPAGAYELPARRRPKATMGAAAFLAAVVLYMKAMLPQGSQAAPAEPDRGPDREDDEPVKARTAQAVGRSSSGTDSPEPPVPKEAPERKTKELGFDFPVASETLSYFEPAPPRAPALFQPGAVLMDFANIARPPNPGQVTSFPVATSPRMNAGPDVPAIAEPRPERPNRAPRLSGPVRLDDISGSTVVAVSLAQLLAGAIDPDGDPLAIKDLRVSAGTMERTADGWQILGLPASGRVFLSYQVTDGEHPVTQVAHFNVVSGNLNKGTEGPDVLTGTVGADFVDAMGGDDAVAAQGGDDEIRGGSGNDRLNGDEGDDVILGEAGADALFGGDGADDLSGGAGDDRLQGGAGDDHIYGGIGNDQIFGGTGSDFGDGGAGDDLVVGDEGNDMLLGGTGSDRLDGGAGDDLLDGGAGDDWLSDGNGLDVVGGGEGNDQVAASADGSDDRYAGGEGQDTLNYSVANTPLSIDLTAGIASGEAVGRDHFSGFETVIAGRGNDRFCFGAGAVSLVGGLGADRFEALAPVSTISRILDFEVGDTLRLSGFDLARGSNGPLGGSADWIYGSPDSDDLVPIRYRTEWLDDADWTVVQADLDGDAGFETAIHLYGQHALFVVQTG